MIAVVPMRFRLAGVIATALALAACGPQGKADQSLVAANATAPLPPLPDALPLASGTATPIAAAPAVSALPRARPLAWGRARGSGEDYAWIDRAYDMTDAIGDAPPDYAFDYDGVSPWAWQTDDDYVTYAEPIDDGYRYYYYQPGANAPFLVRDPRYSYGYSGGRVVAVYDGGGRALAYDQARREADAAARYYARAEALRQAARANNRRAVIAANWAARRDSVARARIELARAQSQQPEWRDYRNRDASQERHWQGEQQRRAVAAQRFASWERDGLRGPPPAVNRAVVQQQQAQARIDVQRQAEAAARQQQALALQQRAQIVAGRQARAEQLAQQRQQMVPAQRQQVVQQRDDVARRQQQEAAAQRQQALAQRQQVAARQQQDQARAAQAQREAAIRQRNQVAAQQQAQRAAVADRRQQTLEAQAAAGRQRQAQVVQRQEAARAAQASRAEAARAHAAEASAVRARQEAVGRERAQQVRAQQADVAQQRAAQARAQQQAVTQARAQQVAARAEQAQAARAQQQATAQARAQQAQAAASARQAQAAQARAAQAAAHPAGPPAGGHGRHEGRRPDQ